MSVGHNRQLIRNGGVGIYYNMLGKSSKKPHFVILHGMGGDLTAWDGIRTILHTKGFSSIAIDLRGHGFSGRPGYFSSYSIDQVANDVVEVIKKEKLYGAILVGHCLGGMIAIEVTHQYSKLAGLILINTTARLPWYVRGIQPFNSYLLRCIGAISPRWRIDKRPDYAQFRNSSDFSPQRILSDIVHTSLKSYCAISSHALTFDGRSYITQFSVPTLVVVGTRDHIITPDHGLKLVNSIPHATLLPIQGGNHVMLFNITYAKKMVDSMVRYIHSLHT